MTYMHYRGGDNSRVNIAFHEEISDKTNILLLYTYAPKNE